jgi:hypothetical protein
MAFTQANVARLEMHFKQQWHFRKEVNCFYQNAFTSNPERLMVNHNNFTVCSVMTYYFETLSQKQVEL